MAPPPQSATASPSSFGGSARPSHVAALSNKVQGLKFMQRAAALNPTTEAATPSSPSGSTPAQATPARASTSTSTTEGSARGGAKESKIVFVDGNEEHWSFDDPSTSAAATTEPEASSSSGSGWNSWLLQASSSSSKGKHRDGRGSHPELASSASTGLGSVGRRKFGTFEGEEKKESEGGGKKKAGDSSSVEGASGKEKAEKKRPLNSREWSVEPSFQFQLEEEILDREEARKREKRGGEDSKTIKGNSGAARYHRGDQTGARREGKKIKKARKSLDDPGVSPQPSRPLALVDYLASSDEESEQSERGPATQLPEHLQQVAAATPQGCLKPKDRRALPSVSFSPSPSARTFASEKIVLGEWLCHVYVAIPLDDYPKLAKLLRKARAALLEDVSTPDTCTWFIDGDAERGEGNLHVSLTQPILVRAHEKDSFLREAKSILEQQGSFALSFSTFTPLPSSPLTSIHPPRVYHTLEVGLGHPALQAISRALGGMVKTFFQGKTYFEEQGARFHASWGYEQVGSEVGGDVSAEQMRNAEQRTQKLEAQLGDRLRALGEVRVRSVEVKIGKQVTRVPLR